MTEELQNLLDMWNKLSYVDRFYFYKTIQLQDGINMQLGVSKGTKIGTASTQKLGLWGATPVTQAAAISAPTSAGVGYTQATAQSAVDAINNIRAALTAAGITA